MPDGRCSVTDGAAADGGDVFLFAPDQDRAGDPAAGPAALRFRGDVRFAGHHGLLFVRIADPWLVLGDQDATLTIDGPDAALGRIPLATVTLGAAAANGQHVGTDVRLTPEGAELFGSVYPAGERFDDLTVFTPLEDTP
jgi:hypothetical protein